MGTEYELFEYDDTRNTRMDGSGDGALYDKGGGSGRWKIWNVW